MSDENIKNKENQDKKEEQNEININDLKEPLMFVDEEKINQKNSETKSCLKKDVIMLQFMKCLTFEDNR